MPRPFFIPFLVCIFTCPTLTFAQHTPATQPATTQPATTQPSSITPPKRPKPSAFGHPRATDNSSLKIFGMGMATSSITYVIDASGSMLQVMPYVDNALEQSLKDLNPKLHKFNIVYFHKGRTIEVADEEKGLASGLKPATPENIKKALAFIHSGKVVTRGDGSAEAALKFAIEQGPESIVLISNMTNNLKDFGNKKALLEELKLFSEQAKAKEIRIPRIHGIQLMRDDKGNTLKKIAKAYRGQFKFISARDLGLE